VEGSCIAVGRGAIVKRAADRGKFAHEKSQRFSVLELCTNRLNLINSRFARKMQSGYCIGRLTTTLLIPDIYLQSPLM
jgi:hypothetical protein